METTTMGRVVVTATVDNLEDLWEVKKGTRRPEEVRRLEISEALVDTGAKLLSLPQRYIQQLGLERLESREPITTGGRRSFDIYRVVELTVQGRRCVCDVASVPDECPVIIGYLPLEQLNFVVDPMQQKLINDPFHKGENLIDML